MELIRDLGVEKGKYYIRYGLYRCPICKDEFKARTNNVKSGRTTKCRSCSSTKHGFSRGKLYRTWASMKDRCSNENNASYHNYGGRGISVCAEWKDYSSFHKWATTNGYEDKLEIDRIDNYGNYCPSNCRFVTRQINSSNRRKTKGNLPIGVSVRDGKYRVKITIHGKSKALGTFNTAYEASKARDEYIVLNELPNTRDFVEMFNEMM